MGHSNTIRSLCSTYKAPAAYTAAPTPENKAPVTPTAAPTTKGPTHGPVHAATLSNSAESSSSGTSSTLVIDDDSHDLVTWLTFYDICSDVPQSKLTIYKGSRDSILKIIYWLHDCEIHAGQILLKRAFPLVDELHDPAITGSMVIPSESLFIQLINVGAHWVCLSTLSCSPGIVNVFESLYCIYTLKMLSLF